jgi:hypothetical protein
MIGKASGPRRLAFRTMMTGRFKSKYYKPNYTHICVVAMIDAYLLGIKGRKAEKLALDIESDLRDLFEDHTAFDEDLSDHGSGSVAKNNPDFQAYYVYIAMKLEPDDKCKGKEKV